MIKFKVLIALSFIIFISALSSVVAADNVENNNFTQLNLQIENSNDFVNLTDDYKFNINDSNLDIRKSIKINGNNHKLDFNNSQLIINSKQSIVFENIVFKNFNPNIFSKNISSINLTFLNCTSDYINPILLIFNPYDFGWSYATNESQYLKVFAEFIVGDSKSIDACKKIANWVGENIDHEIKEGFYQSPKDTLLRKKGNCCSQTELFLQLCDSVGAFEGHKVYFIHVGTKEFHQRHFFAMIDDVFVDVDTYSHSPWGHANFAGRSIYRITEYPYLPLPKQY